jgi:lipopolysaccharide transport system ATP-binding protein
MSAICVENLGKRYIIDHRQRHDTLRDAISTKARGAWSAVTGRKAPDRAKDEFWALRDVSFEVKPGEIVGIIGRNGAGKSTLLKILSRITEPTKGRVGLRGRVACLLEVGTGFHPELTGRDNIYLNGAILGMKRDEIRARFDEIVDFADVERFLDTPVKHYSSGMYVRLAFAVAAHLDPDILIVDEVLAVGDASFQKKCIGRMRSVASSEGRTVLFVSHYLPAIRDLCARSILLENGRVALDGETGRVIDRYLDTSTLDEPAIPTPSADALDRGYVTGLSIEAMNGVETRTFAVGQMWRVRVKFKLVRPHPDLVVGIGIISMEGFPVQTAWAPPTSFREGEGSAVFEQLVALQAGSYNIIIGLSVKGNTFQRVEAGSINISGENPVGFFPVTSGAGVVLNSMRVEVTSP